MSPRPMAPVSRRRFLVGGGALAGAVLLGGCGDEDDAGPTTTAPPTGLVLAQFFGGAPMLAAGAEIRAPFGVADADGILSVDDTPEVLTVSLLDESGATVVEDIEVRRRSEGLPRGYFPLRFTVDEPGIYTGRTEVGGEALEMAIQVDARDDITVIQPGDALPPMETPTRDDAHGVDPICTDAPMCALHEVTVAEALEEGRPIALLVATPAFCQVTICGPVLDVLLAVGDEHPDVRMIHAEVYAHPPEDLDTKAAVVDDLGLTFEPCLVLAGADGTVVERLDTIFDEEEVADALTRLVERHR